MGGNFTQVRILAVPPKLGWYRAVTMSDSGYSPRKENIQGTFGGTKQGSLVYFYCCWKCVSL